MDEILKKTTNGQALSKKELSILLTHIGLKTSKLKLLTIFFNIIFVSFLFILSLGFLFISLNMFLFSLTFIYLLIIIIAYKKYPYYKKIINYFKAIDDFFDKVFKNFYGYEIFRTIHIETPKSYLTKNTVIILVNEIEIMIYDDLLAITNYHLSTYKPSKDYYGILKVIDEKTANKPPISFRFQDINTYKVFQDDKKNSSFSDYQYKNHSSFFSSAEYKNYIEIELRDLTRIKLGLNLLEHFRKYAPLKEIKDNEQQQTIN